MGEKEEVTRALRVVLDTNVVVSALVFREGRLAWLREAWAGARNVPLVPLVPLVSRETVAELVRVLAYPKLGLGEAEARTALAHYLEHAEALQRVAVRDRLPPCRDENDRIFLLLAYAARADALVTGDADLLAVAGKSKIPILTPDALKGRLGA